MKCLITKQKLYWLYSIYLLMDPVFIYMLLYSDYHSLDGAWFFLYVSITRFSTVFQDP